LRKRYPVSNCGGRNRDWIVEGPTGSGIPEMPMTMGLEDDSRALSAGTVIRTMNKRTRGVQYEMLTHVTVLAFFGECVSTRCGTEIRL
jgi:hypothetical protein